MSSNRIYLGPDGTAIGYLLNDLKPVSGQQVHEHRRVGPVVSFAEASMEMDERSDEMSAGCVRIFLVEDNPDHVFIALTVMRQVLGDAIEMLHAQTAEEALDMITQFTEYDRPDLFLVDLRLPDNGGFSVLTAVRQSDVCSRVPLFVVTSSLYDRDIVESYQLGASAVLSKPLSRAKLREELTRVGAIPPVPGAVVQTSYRH